MVEQKEKETDALGHRYTVSHVQTWLINEMANSCFWHLPGFYTIKKKKTLIKSLVSGVFEALSSCNSYTECVTCYHYLH